jgi:hypothetical protein
MVLSSWPGKGFGFKNGDSFICNKPKTVDFLTHIPGDAVRYARQSFQK